ARYIQARLAECDGPVRRRMISRIGIRCRFTLGRNGDEPMQAAFHVQVDADHSRDVQSRLGKRDLVDSFEVARALAIPEPVWTRSLCAQSFPAIGRSIICRD